MEDKTGYGFGNIDFGLHAKGDDVMSAIGSLTEATKDLKKSTTDCGKDAGEVTDWLTIIGKAILAIFK